MAALLDVSVAPGSAISVVTCNADIRTSIVVGCNRFGEGEVSEVVPLCLCCQRYLARRCAAIAVGSHTARLVLVPMLLVCWSVTAGYVSKVSTWVMRQGPWPGSSSQLKIWLSPASGIRS